MNLSELENKALFRRTLWKRHGWLILLVALEVLLLGVLACFHVTVPHGTDVAHSLPLLGYDLTFAFSWRSLLKIAVFVAVQVGFAHRVLAGTLDGDGMVSLHPKDKSAGRTFGGLAGRDLVAMVRKLAQDLGVGRVSKVVVAEKPDANAYTARMLGLGNVVVVHSNLLEVLPREGVRAVLAHELAHVRRRDSLLYQAAQLPTLAAVAIAFLGFLKIAGGVLEPESVLQCVCRCLFLAGTVTATVLAFRLLRRVANKAQQQSELLADAYAAKVCGWEKILNALFLVGERAEALAALTGALRQVAEKMDGELSDKALRRLLNRFPPRELNEDRARVAARLYVEDTLLLLKERLAVPLAPEEIVQLAARAAAPDKTTEAAAPAADAPVLTDWREYDADRSGSLNAGETAALVAELRRDPRRMVFRRSLQPDAEWENHPTMRTRILHLYDLFAPAPARP